MINSEKAFRSYHNLLENKAKVLNLARKLLYRQIEDLDPDFLPCTGPKIQPDFEIGKTTLESTVVAEPEIINRGPPFYFKIIPSLVVTIPGRLNNSILVEEDFRKV